MDILTAKEQVIAIGKKLVEKGLIARTWGNVSCRIDENYFVITPSGKPYESLTPDDIVKVNINTLEYDGNIKPSSEKGVHAEVYKAKRNAGFVIHTHQEMASIISSAGTKITGVSAKYRETVGSEIPIAAYGLPGTKKLMKGVKNVVAKSNARAVILAHHGALCYGESDERAYEAALLLEKECAVNVLQNISVNSDSGAVSDIVSRRDGNKAEFIYVKGDAGETKLHEDIYNAREDISYIIHTNSPGVNRVSGMKITLRPYLDDFAQIIGVSMKTAAGKTAVKALKKRSAVFIKDEGALCCGKNEGDATAVRMIAEKNANTYLYMQKTATGKPINKLESMLMRFVYLKKYSKQAEE